jgi:major membrane immunogen (membrane-anchored lipoprotein)
MKTKFLFITTVLFSLMISCSEDDVVDAIDGKGKITITVNDQKSEYSEVSASLLGDKIVIGSDEGNNEIAFLFDVSLTEGTYQYSSDDEDDTSSILPISYSKDGTAVITVANIRTSSFTITKHDTKENHLKGTFTCTYVDMSKAYTNNQEVYTASGEFDVKYSEILR